MSQLSVDPETVIERLARRVASLATELAMKDAALDDAHTRLERAERAKLKPAEGEG